MLRLYSSMRSASGWMPGNLEQHACKAAGARRGQRSLRRSEKARRTIKKMTSQRAREDRLAQSPVDVPAPEIKDRRRLSREELDEDLAFRILELQSRRPQLMHERLDALEPCSERGRARLVRVGRRGFEARLGVGRGDRRDREGRCRLRRDVGGLELPLERGDFRLQFGDPFCVASFLDLVTARSEASTSPSD